jgi:hypothetical protein
MKTSMTLNHPGGRRWKLLTGILTAGLLAGGLTSCSTTHQVGENEKDFSGFLGDYSLLQKGDGKEANYIYIDKAAPWKTYTKVCILPVELWQSDDSQSPFGKMSHENQQILVNLYHTAMAEAIHEHFEIVNQPGPGVLVVHAAITEARKSKPVLNLISAVYPAALVISYGKQMITGTGTGVGAVRIEMYATDGQTGQRVAEAVDARAGTKAWRTKFDGSWGDVKLSFDWWSERFVKRLQLFQQDDFSGKDL